MTKPVLRLDRLGIDGLERQGQKLAVQLAEVKKSIAAEEARLPSHWPDSLRKESKAKLKEGKRNQLREIETQLLALAKKVKEQGVFFSEAAVRRRAKLSSDPSADSLQTLAAVARFDRSSNGDLADLALDLVSEPVTERSLALGRFLQQEAARRSPEMDQAIGEVLALVEVPAGLLGLSRLLGSIGLEAEGASLEAEEMITGRRAETRRLSLAFAANAEN